MASKHDMRLGRDTLSSLAMIYAAILFFESFQCCHVGAKKRILFEEDGQFVRKIEAKLKWHEHDGTPGVFYLKEEIREALRMLKEEEVSDLEQEHLEDLALELFQKLSALVASEDHDSLFEHLIRLT